MSTPNDVYTPIPLDRCKMTPAGVESVIHHLQQNPAFANQPIARLGAAAIAFLSYGAVNDNRHAVRPGGLHPDHYPANPSAPPNWRTNIRDIYQRVIDDMVRHFAFILV